MNSFMLSELKLFDFVYSKDPRDYWIPLQTYGRPESLSGDMTLLPINGDTTKLMDCRHIDD